MNDGRILRVLVDAGATPLSAARATAILAAGGSVRDAEAVIEVAATETFAADLLVEEARRSRDRMAVRRTDG